VRHFLTLVLFAALVSVVFGIIGRQDSRGRIFYGLKIFLEFVGAGLALSWLLYWVPS
jgi:hypothetical protein